MTKVASEPAVPDHAGPLAGLRVVEFAGLGPAPFAAMMLADHGAQVIRIARREGSELGRSFDLLARGRRHLGLDLKRAQAVEAALRLIDQADVLIEGFRPGVMERLGLGPDVCLTRRPRLVYGRATGWGQSGPLAHSAGHDINYIALSGALHCVGPQEGPPTPVPGFIGDFGGGGMLLAFGVLAALHSAARTGRGQVVDAAVSEGAALLTTLNHGWLHSGEWLDRAGVNMGDGGAPFFNTYRCSDGRHVSIGAIEPQFYRELLQRCGVTDPAFDAQWNRDAWPDLKERFAALFATRSRDEWCALLEGSDACFAPVLSLAEAPGHAHHRARGSFGAAGGVVQPSPAPRFATTPSAPVQQRREEGADTHTLLQEIGFTDEEAAALLADGTAWSAG